VTVAETATAESRSKSMKYDEAIDIVALSENLCYRHFKYKPFTLEIQPASGAMESLPMVISAQSVSSPGGVVAVSSSPSQGRVSLAARSDPLSYADALLASASQVDVSAQALSSLAVADLNSNPNVNIAAAAGFAPAIDTQVTPDLNTGQAASSPPAIVLATDAAAAEATFAATVVTGTATAAGYFAASGALRGLLTEAAAQALSTVATDPAYGAAAAELYASVGAMHSPTNDSQYPLPRVSSPLIPPVLPVRDSSDLDAT
jgi:hypothetical protein